MLYPLIMSAKMEIVRQFQVRGVPGNVTRANFDGRLVDFWGDSNSKHVLVAHDGQNIFDKKTSTRRSTWKLAQSAIRIAHEREVAPPLIIGVFHSGSKSDPDGRYKDLTPLKPFVNGVKLSVKPSFSIDEIRSDIYLNQIKDVILPSITSLFEIEQSPSNTAMLGSSMGGLMALYGVGANPEIYGTSLSFSPHWVISDNTLVDYLIDALPSSETHKLWMSRGTKGHDEKYVPFQNYANQRATANGWEIGRNFSTKIYPRTGHNEKSWQKYVADALHFWLKN
jgi:predicted alpha/beta superfamily hydrolase